jgi:hypothetical protein
VEVGGLSNRESLSTRLALSLLFFPFFSPPPVPRGPLGGPGGLTTSPAQAPRASAR